MLTLAQAEDVAARTLAAISTDPNSVESDHWAADRERLASDLAGLRECDYAMQNVPGAHEAAMLLRVRFAHGLRRTAALYGVTP